MIDRNHLAVLRAAIRFWEEEMGTDINEDHRAYFSTQDQSSQFSSLSIRQLKEFLENAHLGTLNLDPVNGNLQVKAISDPGSPLNPHKNCIGVVLILPEHSPKLGL